MTPKSDAFIKYATAILNNEVVYKKLAKALSKRLYNYLTKNPAKVAYIAGMRMKFGKHEYGDAIFDKSPNELNSMEHEEAIDYMIYALIELHIKRLT